MRFINRYSKSGFSNERKRVYLENWITKYFPGKDHSEKILKERLNIPQSFIKNKV
jgi:hypothetical protein